MLSTAIYNSYTSCCIVLTSANFNKLKSNLKSDANISINYLRGKTLNKKTDSYDGHKRFVTKERKKQKLKLEAKTFT